MFEQISFDPEDTPTPAVEKKELKLVPILPVDSIRSRMDALREELKSMNSEFELVRAGKRTLDEDKEVLEAAFRTALLDISKQKKVLEDQQVELVRNKARIEQEIRDLAAQQARELELAQEIEALQALQKQLEEICADFGAWAEAHPYQMEDIMTIVRAFEAGLNGILNANDMGLGKTFESIIALYIIEKIFQAKNGRLPRVLWLTKKSLAKKSTPNEIRKWWPGVKLAHVDGAKPKDDRESMLELALEFGAKIITNYETVRTTELMAAIQWDIVIIDEVHKLKGGANLNGPTAIWTAIKDVCERAQFVMMLSGTPMVNRPGEMWAYLHIFKPENFPSVKKFEQQYGVMRTVGYESKMVIDADKMLNMALKGQVIRRRRDEVGLQLPIINYITRELDHNPEQRVAYEQMRTRFLVWLNEQTVLTVAAVIAQLTRLRQINVWPVFNFTNALTGEVEKFDIRDSSKIDEAMDIIMEMKSIDEQVVLFSNFNEPMEEIKARCAVEGISCGIIKGDVKNSGELEVNFQQKKLDVICINLAMGEGLNLQKNPEFWPGGSRTAIFLDRWWNPSRNEQAEARIHRQGATDPVDIIILENTPSVDQFIRALCEMKGEEIDGIMEDDRLRPNLREMLDDI